MGFILDTGPTLNAIWILCKALQRHCKDLFPNGFQKGRIPNICTITRDNPRTDTNMLETFKLR